MQDDTKALLKAAFSDVVALLGFVSTLSTFFPVPGAFRPYLWLLGAALIVVGVFRGANKVIAHKNEAFQELEKSKQTECTSLKKRVEELQFSRKAVLAGLITELEYNLRTAGAFFSGPHGSRSYIPPLTEFWLKVQGEVSEIVDGATMRGLEMTYGTIQRWRESAISPRTNPQIGNPEIDSTAMHMRTALPQLITKLKEIREQLGQGPSSDSEISSSSTIPS
jgi:hypothetical protein